MKLQPTAHAFPTEALPLFLDDMPAVQEAKLAPRQCLVVLLQIAASVGVCGAVHWFMA